MAVFTRSINIYEHGRKSCIVSKMYLMILMVLLCISHLVRAESDEEKLLQAFNWIKHGDTTQVAIFFLKNPELINAPLENPLELSIANNLFAIPYIRTALEFAIQCRKKDIVELLLAVKNVDLNGEKKNLPHFISAVAHFNRSWNTPLQLAIYIGNIEIINMLLAVQGININALSRDHFNQTALEIAKVKYKDDNHPVVKKIINLQKQQEEIKELKKKHAIEKEAKEDAERKVTKKANEVTNLQKLLDASNKKCAELEAAKKAASVCDKYSGLDMTNLFNLNSIVKKASHKYVQPVPEQEEESSCPSVSGKEAAIQESIKNKTAESVSVTKSILHGHVLQLSQTETRDYVGRYNGKIEFKEFEVKALDTRGSVVASAVLGIDRVDAFLSFLAKYGYKSTSEEWKVGDTKKHIPLTSVNADSYTIFCGVGVRYGNLPCDTAIFYEESKEFYKGKKIKLEF